MKRAPAIPSLAERQKPGLSVTLPGSVRPDTCQACALNDARMLDVFREYDEHDRPTAARVMLCRPCAQRLVEPHARIYEQLTTNGPHPGAMAICTGCVRRSALACTHPDLTTNGGAGLMLTLAKPTRMHLCRSPRSTSGFVDVYYSPPSACAGRMEVASE